MTKKKLYRFDLDCGRMGDLEGIFVATEDEIASAIGKRCEFGEVLGKHSDIGCDLAQGHIKVLTDDGTFIAQAEAFGLVPMGSNPLHAILCQRCGDALDAPYVECRHKTCGWTRSADAAKG